MEAGTQWRLIVLGLLALAIAQSHFAGKGRDRHLVPDMLKAHADENFSFFPFFLTVERKGNAVSVADFTKGHLHASVCL